MMPPPPHEWMKATLEMTKIPVTQMTLMFLNQKVPHTKTARKATTPLQQTQTSMTTLITQVMTEATDSAQKIMAPITKNHFPVKSSHQMIRAQEWMKKMKAQ